MAIVPPIAANLLGEAEAVAKRAAEWRDGYQLRKPEDAWLFDQMIVSSVRINGCQIHERTLSSYFANRASHCWEADRELDAEALADKLARKPALVSRHLQTTSHGCDALIRRWSALAGVMDRSGQWTENHRSLALDLLGVPCGLRGPEVEAGLDGALARREIERLERLKSSGLDDLNAFERASAVQGQPIATPRPLVVARRDEAAHQRRFQWARKLLSDARIDDEAAPAPARHDPYAPAAIEARVEAFERKLIRRVLEETVAPPPVSPAVIPASCHRSPLPILRDTPTPTPTPAARPRNRRQRRAAERLARSR